MIASRLDRLSYHISGWSDHMRQSRSTPVVPVKHGAIDQRVGGCRLTTTQAGSLLAWELTGSVTRANPTERERLAAALYSAIPMAARSRVSYDGVYELLWGVFPFRDALAGGLARDLTRSGVIDVARDRCRSRGEAGNRRTGDPGYAPVRDS